MKQDYQKALKKLILFFLSNPVLFNGQSYQKQKDLEPVTSHSSGYKTSSENSFNSYILSDQVWWYNKTVFELFQKLHLQIYAQEKINLVKK